MSNGNNLYNILASFNKATAEPVQTPAEQAKVIYESVEAKGSILTGVSKVESKLNESYSKFKEQKYQLNEYLTRPGSPINSIFGLNIFQDSEPGEKLSDHYDDFRESPEWMAIENKYAAKARELAAQISALKGKVLTDDQSKDIDNVWYDGSDAYDDVGAAVDFLPEVYNAQIRVIQRVIESHKGNSRRVNESAENEYEDLQIGDHVAINTTATYGKHGTVVDIVGDKIYVETEYLKPHPYQQFQLKKIGNLLGKEQNTDLGEDTKETSTGRVHKGSYGTEFDVGDDGTKKKKPAAQAPGEKRGRGRPKKDPNANKYDWSAFGATGKNIKLPKHTGAVTKHTLDESSDDVKLVYKLAQKSGLMLGKGEVTDAVRVGNKIHTVGPDSSTGLWLYAIFDMDAGDFGGNPEGEYYDRADAMSAMSAAVGELDEGILDTLGLSQDAKSRAAQEKASAEFKARKAAQMAKQQHPLSPMGKPTMKAAQSAWDDPGYRGGASRSTMAEDTKETPTGRVHKGSYGTEFDVGDDGTKKKKPAAQAPGEKRGRGRPKKDPNANKYDWSAFGATGKNIKLPKHTGAVTKHTLDETDYEMQEARETDPVVLKAKEIAKKVFGNYVYSTARLHGGKTYRMSIPVNQKMSQDYRYGVPSVTPEDKKRMAKLRDKFKSACEAQGIDPNAVDVKYHMGAWLYASVRIAIGSDSSAIKDLPATAKNPVKKTAAQWRNKEVAPNYDQTDVVYEKAPPGAKAERMVKKIKAGYAKDGKLTDKEKSIAYATAWKAHKAGKVEESKMIGESVLQDKSGATLRHIINTHRRDVKDFLQDGTPTNELWDALFDYYSPDMPYGTAKARTGDPIEWVFNRLSDDLENIGMRAELEEEIRPETIPAVQRKSAGKDFPVTMQQLDAPGDNLSDIRNLGGDTARKMADTSMQELDELARLAGLSVKPRVETQVVVDEEEAEYANTPDEEYQSIDTIMSQGDDMNRKKQQFADKPKLGDNPMATRESVDPLAAMGRNLMQEYEALKIKK